MTYVYDWLNRMTAIEENGATSGVGLLASYTYDNTGERSSIARAGGAGATTTAQDDAAGRTLNFAHTFTGGNSVAWTFGCTASNQRSSMSASNDGYTGFPSTSATRYIANGLNQYSTVGGAAYTYGPRGNLSVYGNRNFTFDLENHLISATSPTALTLTYDPVQRLQSTATASASTNFLYDGANLIGEYDGSGAILRRYVFGPNTDEAVVWYEGAGTVNRRWLHADPQGSAIAWSTSGGALGGSNTYGPYGEQTAWSGSRFSYTGQTMIPELQLYYYKARVYDPSIGTFLQADPIGYRSDVNWYAYAGEDPVNGSDPSGLDFNGPTGTDFYGSLAENNPSNMQTYSTTFGAAQTGSASLGTATVGGTTYDVSADSGILVTAAPRLDIDGSNAGRFVEYASGPQGGGGWGGHRRRRRDQECPLLRIADSRAMV